MSVEEIRAEKRARNIDRYVNAYSYVPYLRKAEDFKRVQLIFEGMMTDSCLLVEEREQCLSFFYPQFAEQAEEMAKKKKLNFQPKSYNEMMCIAQPLMVGSC